MRDNLSLVFGKYPISIKKMLSTLLIDIKKVNHHLSILILGSIMNVAETSNIFYKNKNNVHSILNPLLEDASLVTMGWMTLLPEIEYFFFWNDLYKFGSSSFIFDYMVVI